MRLDIVLPNQGPLARDAIQAGARFEEMGYQGLWLTDHVLGSEALRSFYPDYWLEMLTALSYLAAATRTVRLGTSVLILPYRDPVLTAKMLATIDVLSNGRLDVGIGTGWAPREFVALGRGALIEHRGAASDEALDVFLTCWRGGEISHEGRWSRSSKIVFEPTPVQKPHPPIWAGARALAPAPMRRAAKYADVWHPTSITPEEVAEGGARLDALAGRPIARSFRLSVSEGEDVGDLIRRYRDAGCFQVAIDIAGAESLADFLRRAEAIVTTPL